MSDDKEGQPHTQVWAIWRRWMAGLSRDMTERLTVFFRPGELEHAPFAWRRLTEDQQCSWGSRVTRRFQQTPWAQVIVLGNFPLADCGLRPASHSPIHYWYRPNDQVREVVPGWMSPEEEVQGAALSRAQGLMSGEEPSADPVSGAHRRFGERAQPEWDLT